jgi:hypothetical protein
MNNTETMQTFLSDIGAHAGLIQLVIFIVTLIFLAMAGLMANRLFGMLEEARLLYWRSNQQLEAARALSSRPGAGSAAERLTEAGYAHRAKITKPQGKKDLLTS